MAVVMTSEYTLFAQSYIVQAFFTCSGVFSEREVFCAVLGALLMCPR
jgi:hypothetical protein